ncbi:hypothetical protein BCT31_01855 [Vibrio lentus]|uniref:integrase arm-type DNA-binding domain-containing protein n=1 Tax=Vibrio lentus TaxID=136468 RepID=UPI000CC66CF8|nr:integrase arm-type DNA-binding domain-containing protein [Vibrio lentus]PMN54320.1 hypothetical protein BCT31_01855 [Vibrio lentus]
MTNNSKKTNADSLSVRAEKVPKLISQKFTVPIIKEWIKKTKGHVKTEDGKEVHVPYSKEQLIFKDTAFDSGGLMLRISPRGKMTYLVHGRIKGGPSSSRYFNIGNAKEVYLGAARPLALQFKTWMAQGKNPYEEMKQQNEVFTLNQFHEEYLSSRQKRSRASDSGIQQDTINNYHKLFGRLSDAFRTRNALTINRDDVLNEHEAVSYRSTPIMADKTFQYISALYRQAQKVHLDQDEVSKIKSNPVQVLTDTRSWNVNNGQSRRKTECIDTDHLLSVYQAIIALKTYRGEKKFVHKDSQSAVVASYFFRLLMFTGWRPEEVCKITWEQVSNDCRDVSWDDEQAAKKLKGAETQYRAPLNSEATTALLELRNYRINSPFVFPNTTLSGHLKQNPSLYVNMLERLSDTGRRYTAGIFRKTFQTYAEHLNINPDTIKRLVFHTQKHYSIQGGYIFAERENLRNQSQKVANFILSHVNQSNEVATDSILVAPKYIKAALEVIKSDSNDFENVDDVLGHWLGLGYKFDKMKTGS